MNGEINSNEITGEVYSPLKIDKTLTKECMCADAKATGDALALKVNATDIVDNLDSNDATKLLSARQGKELRKLIERVKDAKVIDNLWKDTKITCNKAICYQSGKVCSFIFDFTTNAEIDMNKVTLFAGLPKPIVDIEVAICSATDNKAYCLGVYSTDTVSEGIIATANVSNIPADTRLFGVITYITE